MTRIMGDSTTLTDIPLSVEAVATYVNGSWATTTAQVQARFPRARYGWARIDVNGSHADVADVLDVERGDASPQTAAQWVKSWHLLHPGGGKPVIYCSRSTQGAVKVAALAAGVMEIRDFLWWIATLDGTEVPHRDGDGIVACQRDGQAQTGGHWDRSVIYDPHIWTPAAPPAPVAAPPSRAAAIAALGTLRAYLEAQ